MWMWHRVWGGYIIRSCANLLDLESLEGVDCRVLQEGRTAEEVVDVMLHYRHLAGSCVHREPPGWDISDYY